MKTGGDALLADTHVWMWHVFAERHRASPQAWTAVESAAKALAVAISEISFWEIAVAAHKKRIRIRPDAREWLRMARAQSGFGVIQVERDILVDSALLPWAHRDPADRILVATAMRYDMRVATADVAILDYAQRNRALKVLDMRAG